MNARQRRTAKRHPLPAVQTGTAEDNAGWSIEKRLDMMMLGVHVADDDGVRVDPRGIELADGRWVCR